MERGGRYWTRGTARGKILKTKVTEIGTTLKEGNELREETEGQPPF